MVLPPPIPPSSSSNPFIRPSRPSRHFCQTGELEEGEAYNQALHNMGTTPRERCARFYQEYRGGKRKRKTRKNKKSRKNRRKSLKKWN